MANELDGILEKYIWKAMVGSATGHLAPDDKLSLVAEAKKEILALLPTTKDMERFIGYDGDAEYIAQTIHDDITRKLGGGDE